MADATSNKSPEWIASAQAKVPCTVLPNGNLRTSPVRLSFPNLFSRSKPVPPNLEGKYGANLVFPVGADISILKEEAGKVTKAKWADAGTPKGPKLKSPFKDQADMLRYDGYNEGGVFLSPTSDRQPVVVDANGVVVTDSSRVYPGVWAVCTLRPYTYDKGVNKGTSFGLQSVMLVADDKNLGGGGESIADAFAGVSLDIDSDVDAGGLFD